MPIVLRILGTTLTSVAFAIAAGALVLWRELPTTVLSPAGGGHAASRDLLASSWAIAAIVPVVCIVVAAMMVWSMRTNSWFHIATAGLAALGGFGVAILLYVSKYSQPLLLLCIAGDLLLVAWIGQESARRGRGARTHGT